MDDSKLDEAPKEQEGEIMSAYRAHRAEILALHHGFLEDLRRCGERLEEKFSQVDESLRALTDSVTRRAARFDELDQRLTRLELGDKPPY
jgi:predicted nuclease with TOPRIM domain